MATETIQHTEDQNTLLDNMREHVKGLTTDSHLKLTQPLLLDPFTTTEIQLSQLELPQNAEIVFTYTEPDINTQYVRENNETTTPFKNDAIAIKTTTNGRHSVFVITQQTEHDQVVKQAYEIPVYVGLDIQPTDLWIHPDGVAKHVKDEPLLRVLRAYEVLSAHHSMFQEAELHRITSLKPLIEIFLSKHVPSGFGQYKGREMSQYATLQDHATPEVITSLLQLTGTSVDSLRGLQVNIQRITGISIPTEETLPPELGVLPYSVLLHAIAETGEMPDMFKHDFIARTSPDGSIVLAGPRWVQNGTARIAGFSRKPVEVWQDSGECNNDKADRYPRNNIWLQEIAVAPNKHGVCHVHVQVKPDTEKRYDPSYSSHASIRIHVGVPPKSTAHHDFSHVS